MARYCLAQATKSISWFEVIKIYLVHVSFHDQNLLPKLIIIIIICLMVIGNEFTIAIEVLIVIHQSL